ncbi:hypothetical protein SBRCBS47491_000198 [Sporothrix bragantina]|uniref:Uncharacterized protein n=1 Tax=Sporothrix bragantina TaxID=671064 RepID=A0ABP0ANC7_9PEZI
MSNHPSLHVQPDYQMVPLQERAADDFPTDSKSDYEVFESTAELAKDGKGEPSSATASLLSPSPAPPFSAQPDPGLDPAYLHHGNSRYTGTWPEPKRLGPEWGRRIFSLVAELCIATISLLFAVYGILIYRNEGRSAEASDSTGHRLYEISQYAPTIFPMLFAAVVGSCLKGIVSYSLQTGQGATVGMLEQLLGSQSIYRTFATQIRMHAYNPLGLLLILLWSLSPLGGQASLRVISLQPFYSKEATSVIAINTFQKFIYGTADGLNVAKMTVANPVIAAMTSASMLSTRNQDLWGNVRLPAIEALEADFKAAGNTSTMVDGWYIVPENTNLTYASLVGTPIANLSATGNTSFTLSGAYMSLSCPDPHLLSTGFTNYTTEGNNTAPDPGNGVDCTWTSWTSPSLQLQLAFSMPCGSLSDFSVGPATTRAPRKLVWESFSQDNIYTQVECDVTTTHVDANITCTSSGTGLSADSSCYATHVRRSVDPATANSNWTVFDFGFMGDPGATIQLITQAFPNAAHSGFSEPTVVYMAYPYDAMDTMNGASTDMPTYRVDRPTFEMRLAQILNSVLYLGLEWTGTMTGAFNATQVRIDAPTTGINVTTNILTADAINTNVHQVVFCSRPWLGVLITTSLVLFIMALIGAALRLLTIVPDVLESITLSFLHHQTDGIVGASVWSSSEWARRNRLKRLFFGDVEPTGEVGRLALSTVGNPRPVGPIQVGRVYM